MAASIGVNPHYGGSERRIEAFLLDFEGDLYGTRLRLELWEKLREERAFESEQDLVDQIAVDVEAAAPHARNARKFSGSGSDLRMGAVRCPSVASAAGVYRPEAGRPPSRLPVCGYVGWMPPSSDQRVRAEPLPRIRRAPPRRADAAEVVVELAQRRTS